MKTPIEPSEIRSGDKIRVEWDDTESAEEWRSDGTPPQWSGPHVHYFLLDRPTSPVELPEEPALGWVETAQVGSVLGVWYTNDRNPRPEQLLNHKTRSQRYRRDIIAFTPATAVSTEALDELRHRLENPGPNFMSEIVEDFLAAIDKAANA